MKELVAWLFSQNNSNLKIGLFDEWHFLYLFVIFGGTLTMALYGRKHPEKQCHMKRLTAYLTIGIYLIDFFIMPLSDSYNRIDPGKLPFHICTLMGVLVPFVQFNSHFAKFKQPIVTLSVASSLMWMCYPGSALGGQPPFSYVILQTFMFHGFLFCWGVLNLAFGDVKYDFRKIWQELAVILGILVWASLGNTVYDIGYNWFFIEYSIFPFLTDKMMPFTVVFCVFGTSFLVYCTYFALKSIHKKRLTKKDPHIW